MTANIGPGNPGETYEHYSACGPILSGTLDEPSLYYQAADLGEIPEGCPAEACVIAGTLEFGAKWEQQFAIGLVWFTLISSLALWVFYTWSTFKATCGWEEFYVVNMESMQLYLLILRVNFVGCVQFFPANTACLASAKLFLSCCANPLGHTFNTLCVICPLH